MQLPDEFVRRTEALMGCERFERYLKAFGEDAPVSIRLNPRKTGGKGFEAIGGEPVPWCREGYYLPTRPNFTFDPLFHAGCYYVQEAASMFLDEVLRQHFHPSQEGFALDLCAAPGGKSTLMRSALPEGYALYSNEPIRQRASILLENVQKWGYADHFVTNLYPKDYRKSKMKFDIILCDVPCSGEGMFRKDEATIREWSPQNVEKCQQLQRDIVNEAWQCLNDGGLFIYSTCTFNTKENEENIRWMISELDARVLNVETADDWHITGSLLPGFNEPVYRFIPGISRGEGLFMAVMRKRGETNGRERNNGHRNKSVSPLQPLSLPKQASSLTPQTEFPQVSLSYSQALAYLRHEAIVLSPEAPRGLVEVCFMGEPLGPAKNIGSRANNLYPKEWKIKTTHIPNEYEAILRHT
ncbi:MAG: hypothetical protein K2G91_04345 [Prevotella sp.]|nr:hypothetical protein [Prevotella sp.]